VIVLLYAQPLTRVVRLTIDDVIRDSDQVLLQLGEPPSPVPEPVADILLAWIDNRKHEHHHQPRFTLAVPWPAGGTTDAPGNDGRPTESPWRPECSGTDIGNAAARPADASPVVADALGYHPVTTTKLADEAAATWSRYVTTPRFRSPDGWKPSTG
jgi:hypothetical protein